MELRLKRLERCNRLYLSALVALCAFLIVGAGRAKPKTIEAEAVVLKDGKNRCVITANTIKMWEGDSERLNLSVGAFSELVLSGKLRAVISTKKNGKTTWQSITGLRRQAP